MAAAFVSPLSDQTNDQGAHWSPESRKSCSCVTAAALPLCFPWTIKTAVDAEPVTQRRQSGGKPIGMAAQRLPWSPNGNTVVAQWTPSVGKRRHTVGTREAKASSRLKDNVYNRTHSIMGWPLADRWASILRSRRWVWLPCLVWATCEQATSSVIFLATVLNTFKTSRQPWLPWRRLAFLCTTFELLNDEGNHAASFVPPTTTWSVLWSHKGDRKVAVPCKGVWKRPQGLIAWRHRLLDHCWHDGRIHAYMFVWSQKWVLLQTRIINKTDHIHRGPIRSTFLPFG